MSLNGFPLTEGNSRISGGDDESFPIGVNAEVARTSFPFDNFSVELTDVADNCSVEGDKSRTLPGELSPLFITFNVSCVETKKRWRNNATP